MIDIIRDYADKEYLDLIKEKQASVKETVRNLVYLDRNNTADIWADISTTIKSSSKDTAKVIALMPCMGEYDPVNTYKTRNPLSPEFFFECVKRIYGRKEHSCLSSANKPKVIDVLVKFTKLYDGADFKNEESLSHFFDQVYNLDFANVRNIKLTPETRNLIIKAMDETPQGFVSPTDEMIEALI